MEVPLAIIRPHVITNLTRLQWFILTGNLPADIQDGRPPYGPPPSGRISAEEGGGGTGSAPPNPPMVFSYAILCDFFRDDLFRTASNLLPEWQPKFQ
jgi:hypothetical protein